MPDQTLQLAILKPMCACSSVTEALPYAEQSVPKDGVLHVQVGCWIEHYGKGGASTVGISMPGHRKQTPPGVLQLFVDFQRNLDLISFLQGMKERLVKAFSAGFTQLVSHC